MEKDDDLIKLEEYEFQVDAQIIKTMLEGNGIPAMVTGELDPYGSVFAKPRGLVFRRDEAAARRLMEQVQMSDDDLDAMAEADVAKE